MKTLGKLKINPEKIIKNEELIILRGGYSTFICHVVCNGLDDWFNFSSTCNEMDWSCAISQCITFYEQQFSGCDCACIND